MNHDQWLEQADVYAAGALDGRELAEFEAHLATGCAICAERLRETREALALLPRSLPEVPPPPALRARVLDAIAAERRPATAPSCHSAPAAPAPRHLVGGLDGARGGGCAPRRRQRAAQGDAGGAPRLAGPRGDAPDGARPARGGDPVLSDPKSRYVSLGGLKPTPEASAGSANPATRQGLLWRAACPPRRPRHAYELWALAGAQPVPAGVFSADAAGRALLRLPPLPEGHTYDAFAVTSSRSRRAEAIRPMHLHGKVL